MTRSRPSVPNGAANPHRGRAGCHPTLLTPKIGRVSASVSLRRGRMFTDEWHRAGLRWSKKVRSGRVMDEWHRAAVEKGQVAESLGNGWMDSIAQAMTSLEE